MFGATSKYGIGTGIVAGDESVGIHLIINDIDGARWALATGSYDLTFYKHKADTDTWEKALILHGDAANNVPQLAEFFVPIKTSGSITVGGDVNVAGGINLTTKNITFKADDTGDIVFQNADGTEKARIWAGTGAGVNELYIRTAGTMAVTIDSGQNVKLEKNLTVGGKYISNLGTGENFRIPFDIPTGITTEVGGTTPLLNLDVNFRFTDKNTDYIGGAFRIDARSPNYPLFQWLVRKAGSTAENVIMSLSEDGDLDVDRDAYIGRNLTVGGWARIKGNKLFWTDAAVGDHQHVFIQGKTSDGYHFDFLPCDNAGAIASNFGKIGIAAYYWREVTANYVNYKSLAQFSCDPSLADKPVPDSFQSVDEAERFLRHEALKTVYHTPLVWDDKERMYKLRCPVCRRLFVDIDERTHPEHVKEFRDRYTRDVGKMIMAMAKLVLYLLDRYKILEKKFAV